MSDTPVELVEDVLVAGRYRVHERVGAGGMGVVFRATDTRLKRQVALKRVLLHDDADDDRAAEIRHRTLREAEIAARVHHPRIVSIFDVLDDPGGPLLVLEYLPSRSLGELVAELGVLTPGTAARVGAQVAEALAAAHAAGIVHRDVKPGNVLVGPGDPVGPVKLADFGISQAAGTGTLTATGIGTPAYFAPEIARGDVPRPASDVYALGATLSAVVQGAPPFGWSDPNPLSLIQRIARDPVPVPTIGGPLGDLLARMTAGDPSERPVAADAVEELWRLADRTEPLHPASAAAGSADAGDTVWRPAEPTVAPAGADRPRRRRRAALAGAAVLVAAAVVGGVLVAGPDPEPAAPGPAAPAALPATVPALTIGDPRTADPCSLVRPDALRGFGAPTVVPDYDGFASCQIDVAQRGSDLIEVSTRFVPPSGSPPRGARQRLGEALIVRPERDGDDCRRDLVLADGTPIEVDTSFYGQNDPVSDVCDVAESAVASAATSAAESGIGRREPPSTGLWTTDACSLLSPEDLSFLPPEKRSDRYRGYAGWKCDWSDGRDPELGITVSFDRYAPPSETGLPVPGTPAFTRADADDRCNGEVPVRPFLGSDGKPRAEVLRVLVEGSLPRQELCDRAGRLVALAATKVRAGR